MSIGGGSFIELADKQYMNSDGRLYSFKFLSIIDESRVEIALKQNAEITYTEWLSNLIKFAVPSIIAMFWRRSIDIISYLFLGRLDESDYIAGAGLGILSWNVICYCAVFGIAGGIDTLWSQAFGHNNPYLAGWYLHRAQIIFTLLFIPQALILGFIYTPLKWIGQPESSAFYAQEYCRCFLVGLFALGQLEILSRFLWAQGKFLLICKVQVWALLYHVIVCYIWIDYLDLQLIGVGLSCTITHTSTLLFVNWYINCVKDSVKEKSWHWYNSDSFRGIWEFLKIGIPSILMVALECWCFEVLTIFSGYLGTNEQGATIIIINISGTLFMMPLGLSFATSNLVGSSLGAGKPQVAKRYAKIAISVAVVCVCCSIFAFLMFHKEIAHMFTSHEGVANIVSLLLPLASLFLFSDYVQAASTGPIRAMGYQKYATIICIWSHWFVAVPLTFLFTFYLNFGVYGIFMGKLISPKLKPLLFQNLTRSYRNADRTLTGSIVLHHHNLQHWLAGAVRQGHGQDRSWKASTAQPITFNKIAHALIGIV